MKWRLLETGHATPAWNMALDEALLEAEDGVPVLRLYRWRPEALSLGRFQPLSELGHVPGSIARVRRLTGGGAIHHREDELTYSIVARYSVFGGRGSPKDAYRAVHAAIEDGLRSLGFVAERSPLVAEEGGGPASALCYDRATDFDLRAGAKKLVGSAQRRKGAAFLQHGSIPVSRDPFSPGAVSLSELLGRTPEPAALERAVREGFARAFAAELVASALTDAERALAAALEERRYSSQVWTAERP